MITESLEHYNYNMDFEEVQNENQIPPPPPQQK